MSKEREVIVYCPCEGSIKISKNLMFLPWYYFNVYREYSDFISWNYYHFENYKLKIHNPILFLTDKTFPNHASFKSFNKVILNNEEFEWEMFSFIKRITDEVIDNTSWNIKTLI